MFTLQWSKTSRQSFTIDRLWLRFYPVLHRHLPFTSCLMALKASYSPVMAGREPFQATALLHPRTFSPILLVSSPTAQNMIGILYRQLLSQSIQAEAFGSYCPLCSIFAIPKP